MVMVRREILLRRRKGFYLFLLVGFVPKGGWDTISCTIATSKSSKLLPGVMQNLTPLTKIHKVIFIDLYFAGNFSLINVGRVLGLFLPYDKDTIAEFLDSCKFASTPLSLPASPGDRAALPVLGFRNYAPYRDLIKVALHKFIVRPFFFCCH